MNSWWILLIYVTKYNYQCNGNHVRNNSMEYFQIIFEFSIFITLNKESRTFRRMLSSRKNLFNLTTFWRWGMLKLISKTKQIKQNKVMEIFWKWSCPTFEFKTARRSRLDTESWNFSSNIARYDKASSTNIKQKDSFPPPHQNKNITQKV